MEEDRNPSLLQSEKKPEKKKITITVDEDDPCIKKVEKEEEVKEDIGPFPTYDPRFQQQNQTQRCFVMYTDFYRCEHILGENTEACKWFKNVFKTICPNAWIERWDDLRLTGRFAWHKYRTQGPFPGDKYGE